MENLELKHITPYLPYGLEADFRLKHGSGLPLPKHQLEGIIQVDCFLLAYLDSEIEYFKPILRPLSDLDKEITINDDEYILPIQHIFYEWRKDLVIKKSYLNGVLDEIWLDYEDENGDFIHRSSVTFNDWQFLLENHFDVFGLIDKGLAIDINDLND